MMVSNSAKEETYANARQRYGAAGIDIEGALARLAGVTISLHCWQGDDITGFEQIRKALGAGLAVTGNYPGRARNAGELRQDLDEAFRLIPGNHRLNLHAIYAETGDRSVERNALRPEHFSRWLDWAKAAGLGLDFNPTCFSHPLAESGWTLASYDPAVRQFWIEHCQASRKIGAYFGRELGTPCITNIWIPDGFKDLPVDRLRPRQLLQASLDQILADPLPQQHNLDAVESKLFGLGSESYVAGSHEFYLGYALRNNTLLCLDSGHFHPTEDIADKLSAILLYLPRLLLHISRGVRWDSDHVVLLDDQAKAIAQEIVRGRFLDRIQIGLDYFDATINRVAAWVLGTRNVQRALLLALLEPTDKLRELEVVGDFTARLTMLEAQKSQPFGVVWDTFCRRQGAPLDGELLGEFKAYEKSVLANRR
jgi:L-rhamnose isomerase